MAQNNVVASSWRGLMQYVTKNLIGNGYYYWHFTELPVHKKSKWGQVDKKFIEKYQTDKSKFQRSRRKKDGIANFIYVRWDKFSFVFHTEGTIPSNVDYSDIFQDIRRTPIFLKISDETAFDIQLANNGKAHVKLNKETYLGLKALFHNVASNKNAQSLQKVFQMVNGLPNYSGVVDQKKRLREFVVRQAEKHDILVPDKDKKRKKRKMQYKDFWIYTKNDTINVFDSPSGGGHKK